jgi:response regulator RpfG family c-di-GMP phosphodiesterase
MCKILVVDDTEKIRGTLENVLCALFPEHKVYSLDTTEESFKLLEELGGVEIIFFNSLKNSEPDGASFATKIRDLYPFSILIYINPSKEVDYGHLLKLSKIGIDGYLKWPIGTEMLQFQVINGLSRLKLIEDYKKDSHKEIEAAVDNFSTKVDKFILEQSQQKTSFWKNLFT